MIILKTPDEIKIMRAAGQAVAEILKLLEAEVRPGVSTAELNALAESETVRRGGIALFKNYPNNKEGGQPFPGAICASINEEVVHGIPSRERILAEGDILSLDLGAGYKGIFTDMATTVAIGQIAERHKKLLRVTEESLYEGIKAAKVGNRIGDISHTIQNYVETRGFEVVRQLVGHGVGKKQHDAPQVPNFGNPHTGEDIVEGMTLAIEPMVTDGDFRVYTAEDGWTVKTVKGVVAAHFEHTIIIENGNAVIVTK